MTLHERFHECVQNVKPEWDKHASKTWIPKIIDEDVKRENEIKTDRNFQNMQLYMKQYTLRNRKRWGKQGNQFIQKLLDDDALLITTHMNKRMKQDMIKVSKQFIQDVRAFDQDLPFVDIAQALRNVWIFIVLELLFGKPIRYHKAIFGYSMLYPYSDNWLDDPTLNEEDKKRFNCHFYQRLRGATLTPDNHQEEKIFAMISCIESVYDRTLYPDVYESLYLIMEGQIKSLKQHGSGLSHDEILDISIEKGAASVVADGFLICGEMNEQEMAFCIRYGFMLQLGDDLQDLKEDRKNCHQTIYSIMDPKQGLDAHINQLLSYTDGILDEYDCDPEIKKLLIENCELLVLLSALQQSARCTDDFMKRCIDAMPFHMEYIQGINEKWISRQDSFDTIPHEQIMGMLDAIIME